MRMEDRVRTGAAIMRPSRSARLVGLVVGLSVGTLATSACGDEFAAPDVISVTLDVAGAWTDTIGDAQVASLTIRVSGESGARYDGVPLRWSLSDSSVLSLARPVTLGSASTAERLADEQRVLIVPRRVGVSMIVARLEETGFAPAELRLPVVVRSEWPSLLTVGTVDTLAIGSAGADPAVLGVVRYTWTSTDPSVASVQALSGDSARAGITARASGLVQVTVTATGERIGQLQWTRTVATGSVQLAPSNEWPPYLPVANTAALSLAVLDANGVPFPSAVIDWASTNEASFVVVPTGTGGLLTTKGRGAGEVVASVGRPPFEVRQYRWRFLVGERWGAVSAGARHTCALTAIEGIASCWGSNATGELGLAVDESQAKLLPSRVATSHRFSQIVTGGRIRGVEGYVGHTCGREGLATLLCWGSRFNGQLGDGATYDDPWYAQVIVRRSPLLVVNNGALGTSQVFVNRVIAGGAHTCIENDLSGEAQVRCWGMRDYGGAATPIEFGRTAAEPSSRFFSGQLSAGGSHACYDVFTFPNPAYGTHCAGENESGQLGDGTTIARSAFAPVVDVTLSPFSRQFYRSFGGGRHACAFGLQTALWCWGSNSHGQLGVTTTGTCGGTPCSTVALELAVPVAFDSVALGDAHSCVRSTAGDAWCWGSNSHGQLGRESFGGSSATPAMVAGDHKFVSLSAGGNHTCGVTTLGAIMCWGSNAYGQLGDGTRTDRSAPTRVEESP